MNAANGPESPEPSLADHALLLKSGPFAVPTPEGLWEIIHNGNPPQELAAAAPTLPPKVPELLTKICSRAEDRVNLFLRFTHPMPDPHWGQDPYRLTRQAPEDPNPPGPAKDPEYYFQLPPGHQTALRQAMARQPRLLPRKQEAQWRARHRRLHLELNAIQEELLNRIEEWHAAADRPEAWERGKAADLMGKLLHNELNIVPPPSLETYLRNNGLRRESRDNPPARPPAAGEKERETEARAMYAAAIARLAQTSKKES